MEIITTAHCWLITEMGVIMNIDASEKIFASYQLNIWNTISPVSVQTFKLDINADHLPDKRYGRRTIVWIKLLLPYANGVAYLLLTFFFNAPNMFACFELQHTAEFPINFSTAFKCRLSTFESISFFQRKTQKMAKHFGRFGFKST